ncbi:high-affinity Zn(2+) transporter zrt1 [Mortierella sp. GBA35]|nr:high-affinity Zn(2+) transporter zrt1 [Mortierella sp. GBA35]
MSCPDRTNSSQDNNSDNYGDDDHSLSLHLLGVLAILTASTLGVLMPLIATKVHSCRLPTLVLTLGRQFGTGVILATAMIHTLPTAMSNLSSPCLGDFFSKDYPVMGGLLVLVSSLLMHWIEFMATEFNQTRVRDPVAVASSGVVQTTTGHGRGGGAAAWKTDPADVVVSRCPGHTVTVTDESDCDHNHGDEDPERAQLLPAQPPTTPTQYEQYESGAPPALQETQDGCGTGFYGAIADMTNARPPSPSSSPQIRDRRHERRHHHHHYHHHHNHNHDHNLLGLALPNNAQRRISTYILEAGVAAHSVIIGVTLGVSSGSEFTGLLIALLFHQFFEGFALGARIADLDLEKTWTHYLLALIFSLTTPFGVLIGIGVSNTYQSDSVTALLTEGTLDAISTGILLYMGYVTLLAVEFNLDSELLRQSSRVKSWCFFALWTGAGLREPATILESHVDPDLHQLSQPWSNSFADHSRLDAELQKLKQRRLLQLDNGIYIPPQANVNLQAPNTVLFPLMEKIRDFLDSDRQVFLLLGDSGTGKSTFNRHLESYLWDEYQDGDPIPPHISFPATEKPDTDMISKQLRRLDFSDTQIQELKCRHFVLICDGYDEARLANNPDTAVAEDLFQEAVIVPFSTTQIENYINQHVSLQKSSWSTKEYMDRMAKIPNLMELVTDPFLLTLALETLQTSEGFDSNKPITRVILYDKFVDQWMEINKQRLEDSPLSKEDRSTFHMLLDDSFTRRGTDYLKELPAAMFKEQAGNSVVYDSQAEDNNTWKAAFFGSDPSARLLLDATEDSKVDAEIAQAAANAISTLTSAGTRFNGADLRGIRIHGADLRGGEFDSTDFEGADLSEVNLGKAWFRQAKLNRVQMAGVQFGEFPFLNVGKPIQKYVFSPDGKLLAVSVHGHRVSIYETAIWSRIAFFSGGPAIAISPTIGKPAKGG